MSELLTLKIAHLVESKTNPRQTYDKEALKELADSIKAKGILEPLIARKAASNGNYEIVVGSRRFRAAKLAGLEEVPAVVRQLSDEECIELQVIENEQRADVHPMEQAIGYERMFKAGHSYEEIAARIGKTPGHVRFQLQYTKLIEPVKKAFLANQIGSANALQISRLQPDRQKEVWGWFKNDDWTPARLAQAINQRFFLILSEAPFDPKDKTLIPAAGSCMDCPKRAGADTLLFPDIKDKDTCTDSKCFEAKQKSYIARIVQQHPDAIRLTIGQGYFGSPKPIGLTNWVKAGKHKCDNLREGVVVEIITRSPHELQKAKLGQVLQVCTGEKCKVHREAPERHAPAPSGKKKPKTVDHRKIELRRRGMVFKELASVKFDVDDQDMRGILDWAVTTLSNDHARSMCYAMDWEAAKGQYGGRDFRGEVKKRLAKVPLQEVERWLYLVMLAETDLWFFSHSKIEKTDALDSKAKDSGVQLKALAEDAKLTPKQLEAKLHPKKETTKKAK